MTTPAAARRPSHISLTGLAATVADPAPLTSPRTPKLFGRRSSSAVDATTPPCAAVNMSPIAPLTPALLREHSTAGYFDQDFHACHARNGARYPSGDPTTQTDEADGHHRSYKIKAAKPPRKLDQLFGEQAPLDICVREIRTEGLGAMLRSKTPLCYFLHHLLQEHSSENLFFFLQAEQYGSLRFATLGQQLAAAQHIYNVYLTHNSHFEINLDDRVRRAVAGALGARRVDGCFDVARRAVYSLLESSYMRFMVADAFERMAQRCGELTTQYGKDVRNTAIHQLMSYLEQQQHTDPSASATTAATRQRHTLVRSMVHEFCRTVLGVQIEYSSSKPKPSISSKPFEFLARLKQHGNN